MTHPERITRAQRETACELKRAVSLYPPMHSAHEGYAVIREEFEELWAEIKRRPADTDMEAMREEAVQLAAMAQRLLVDVIYPALEAEA